MSFAPKPANQYGPTIQVQTKSSVGERMKKLKERLDKDLGFNLSLPQVVEWMLNRLDAENKNMTTKREHDRREKKILRGPCAHCGQQTQVKDGYGPLECPPCWTQGRK